MPPTYVCITTRTLPSASTAPSIIGYGLFVAAQGRDRWRFRRSAYAIGVGAHPTWLLRHLTTRLPPLGHLIAWDEAAVTSRLMTVAACAPAPTPSSFLSRYENLRRCVIDLCPEANLAPSSFAESAAGQAIYAPVIDDNAVRAAWASGDLRQIRRDLADEATALWWMFLRSAGGTGFEAEEATRDWTALRQFNVREAGTG